MKKRGTILVENVIFIILNLLFLSILVLFLVKQGSGAIVLEETYAKQIAMIANSATPTMLIKIDMEKGMKLAEKNGISINESVRITGNVVTVKLSERGGYNYAFFNNIEVSSFAERDDYTREYTGMYIFTINKKEGENE